MLLYQGNPEEIYQDSQVPIGFVIQNNGANSIGDGRIVLTLDENYLALNKWNIPDTFSILNDKITFNLDGKSIENKNGEKKQITAFLSTKVMGSQIKQDNTKFILTACYNYKTNVDSEVCINTKEYDSSIDVGCEVKDVHLTGGQGAPVSVTDIKVKTRPHSSDIDKSMPVFEIYLENKGQGDIVNKNNTLAMCGVGEIDAETIYKEWLFDRVDVSAKLSGEKLDCFSNYHDGFIILGEEKENKITCKLTEGIENNKIKKSPLNIVLDYGYVQTMTHEMIIYR